MSPEEYVKEREKAIAQENGLPKEGDLRQRKDENNFHVEECFYQGKWVNCTELPKDHPNYTDLPF